MTTEFESRFQTRLSALASNVVDQDNETPTTRSPPPRTTTSKPKNQKCLSQAESDEETRSGRVSSSPSWSSVSRPVAHVPSSSMPDHRHFRLTGASGTGRTTFVNTLCESDVLAHKQSDSPETAHIEEGIRIKPMNVGPYYPSRSMNVQC